jgi:hypothetical protein
MSDRRKEERATAEVDVRVSALSGEGTLFVQSATARNLSTSGGLLTCLQHKLRCGDLVRVQHGDHHARFRVVWIANSAHGPFTAAIHKVKDDTCPWTEALTESTTGMRTIS